MDDLAFEAWLERTTSGCRTTSTSSTAPTGWPYEALEALAMMRRLYDDLEYEIVALARSYRWSWRDVGDALQVSRSAAQRRFAQYEVPYRVRRQQKGPSNKGPF